MRGYVMSTLRRERLLDELVEAYIDRRETCARVNDTYRSRVSERGLCGRVALRVVLHGSGFEGMRPAPAAEALDRGALRSSAAAIIELVLPDGDGVDVCRRLREGNTMPVILLTIVVLQRLISHDRLQPPVLTLQLLQPPGLIGLRPAVLVAPPVRGRLGHLQRLGHLRDRLALPEPPVGL